jgi:hypothetical protein
MPNARKNFFHTSKSRLSPLNFGSFTEFIACASDALSIATENQEKPTKKNTEHRSRGGATRLRKGYDKGLTEDEVVLPESIQPRQSKTSLRRSVK